MIEAQQRQYHTLILASLLHDIGKLLNKPKPEKAKKHAIYSEEFLRQNEISGLLQDDKFAQDIDFELLCYLVLRHDPYIETNRQLSRGHHLLRLIRAADGYSAGERSLSPLYGQPPTGELALDSIFIRRDLGRPLSQVEPRHRPRVLSPVETFPETGVEPLTEIDYQPLQDNFEKSYRHALNQAQNWPELEAWTYSLLERYTWAVPSALHREPRDISLFDHARTSCAIAAALYLYYHTNQPQKRPPFLLIKGDVSGVQDYIYSVANVGPGGVAKRLRARSFFITALTEVVAHRLRDELVDGYALPIAAAIFNGGGQFVLLAPNLEIVETNLAKIETEINAWLWQEFQGDLAFVFGVEAVSGEELALKPKSRRRNICQALAALDQKVEAAKEKRLGALLQPDGRWQPLAFKWAPPDKSYPHGDCPSCGRLPARAGEDEPDIDQRLCERCAHERRLSEQIVKAKYIAYWWGTPPTIKGRSPGQRRLLTFFTGAARRHVVLLSTPDEGKEFDHPPYQLDGFGYETPTPESPPLVRHFANYVPRFQNLPELAGFCTAERGCVYDRYTNDEKCGILVRPDPLESRITATDFPILQNFGCLSAAAAEGAGGRLGMQLLGVLRADVDNLRLLFSDSFEEDVQLAKGAATERRAVRSLSRLATLSRMIDLFFSGWVHETLAHPPKGKRYDRIYTVYAGGDDLCLVGPWDVLIDFTRCLASEFERYTGSNPNLTLSAAIAVTKPQFPIATSARQAGDLLKAAKNAGRGRLNLFGVIARWRDLPPYRNLKPELKTQLDQQEQHANLLLNDLWLWAERLDEQLSRYLVEREAHRRYPISPAFVHRLLHYAEMARAWEQNAGIRASDMLYLARLAYDLGRNVIEDEEVNDDIKKELIQLTHLANRKVMAGMRMPITYALYRNRERSQNDES